MKYTIIVETKDEGQSVVADREIALSCAAQALRGTPKTVNGSRQIASEGSFETRQAWGNTGPVKAEWSIRIENN